MAAHKAGLFDLRLVIAVLFAIYGVVLVVVGLAFTDESDLAKADGLNINLWSGIGMVVVSALFAVWATTRPVLVPDEPAGGATGEDATGGSSAADGPAGGAQRRG